MVDDLLNSKHEVSRRFLKVSEQLNQQNILVMTLVQHRITLLKSSIIL